MATGIFVPVEVYLRSSEYEPDAEYVDGEIEARSVGEFGHADWHQAIQRWFAQYAQTWNLRALSELRVQVTPTRFCIPDVTVLDRSLPVERIITRPPIAVFNVLSPEDTVIRQRRKLDDYAKMGIPQIWVVDPENGRLERYESDRLVPASRFEHAGMQFDLSEIASLLQG
jgi:Uma2 family endonuclease